MIMSICFLLGSFYLVFDMMAKMSQVKYNQLLYNFKDKLTQIFEPITLVKKKKLLLEGAGDRDPRHLQSVARPSPPLSFSLETCPL